MTQITVGGVPTPWATIVVKRGEKNKHLYWDADGPTPGFHPSESAAYDWAYAQCRIEPNAEVLVLKTERLVRALPATFELVAPEFTNGKL